MDGISLGFEGDMSSYMEVKHVRFSTSVAVRSTVGYSNMLATATW